MSRQWRAGSKARAAKIGRPLPPESIPTIDEVEAHLKLQPLECTYCRRRLSASKAGKPQMDHRWPIARGGGAHVQNLVLSCGGCNRSKGEMTETEFRAILQTLSYFEDKGKDVLRRLKLGWFSHS